MVQRDDILLVAFGGVLIGLVMMLALPFNVLVVGALATCLLAVFGTFYGSDTMGRVKTAVASTEVFAEQIPVRLTPHMKIGGRATLTRRVVANNARLGGCH